MGYSSGIRKVKACYIVLLFRFVLAIGASSIDFISLYGVEPLTLALVWTVANLLLFILIIPEPQYDYKESSLFQSDCVNGGITLGRAGEYRI